MRTRRDPEFGHMTEDAGGDWRLDRPILFAGARVPIFVESGEGGGFDPVQRRATRLVLSLGPDAAEQAAPAVVQNYEVYREAIGDQEQMPRLESLADVWKQVHIECVRVPRHHGTHGAYFEILAECDWDPEHGLEIRFRDGAAIEADQQGETGGAHDDPPEYLEEVGRLIADAVAGALREPGRGSRGT